MSKRASWVTLAAVVAAGVAFVPGQSEAVVCASGCAPIGVGLRQEARRVEGRLSVVPVNFGTYRRTSGAGRAEGTVEGGALRIEGSYEGTFSPVTGAVLHAARPGTHGPEVGALETSGGTSGRIAGTLRLTEELREALDAGHLYLVVRTEGNPEGELRGWLFPTQAASGR